MYNLYLDKWTSISYDQKYTFFKVRFSFFLVKVYMNLHGLLKKIPVLKVVGNEK
jgi:hypothetical protein